MSVRACVVPTDSVVLPAPISDSSSTGLGQLDGSSTASSVSPTSILLPPGVAGLSCANSSSSRPMVPGPTSPNCSEPRFSSALNFRAAAAVFGPYVPSAPVGPRSAPRSTNACCTLITGSPPSPSPSRAWLSKQASRIGTPANRGEARSCPSPIARCTAGAFSSAVTAAFPALRCSAAIVAGPGRRPGTASAGTVEATGGGGRFARCDRSGPFTGASSRRGRPAAQRSAGVRPSSSLSRPDGHCPTNSPRPRADEFRSPQRSPRHDR